MIRLFFVLVLEKNKLVVFTPNPIVVNVIKQKYAPLKSNVKLYRFFVKFTINKIFYYYRERSILQ
jgi:hypothetical protein